LVLGDSIEVSIHHGVWISFSTLDHISAMVEASQLKHRPNGGVTPEVGNWLRQNLDIEIIVFTFHWNS